MTDEKMETIRSLSKAYMEKKLHFDALGARNIYDKTSAERILMMQETHVAEAEMLEAHAALQAAIRA